MIATWVAIGAGFKLD